MLSEGLKIALVAAISQVLPALLSWRSKKETTRVKEHVVDLKVQVNGRLDQLLKESNAAARAAGRREGIEIGRKEAEEKFNGTSAKDSTVARRSGTLTPKSG